MLRDRGLEEVQDRRVVPDGRVRDVDDDLCTLERFGQPLAGDRVDAGVRRRRERVVAVVAQLLDELRPDEAGPADDNDLHLLSFRLSLVVDAGRLDATRHMVAGDSGQLMASRSSERERRHQDDDGHEEEDETKNCNPGRPLAFAYLLDLVKMVGFSFDRVNRSP